MNWTPAAKRRVAVAVTFFFTFVFYSPAALAISGEMDRAASDRGKAASVSAERAMAERLHALKFQLAGLDRKTASSAGDAGRPPTKTGVTEEAVLEEIARLRSDLGGFRDKVPARFDEVGARLEKKGLSERIFERHRDAVRIFKGRTETLRARLEEVGDADPESERTEALQRLSAFLQKQQFKRSHQPFDPNNLPFRTPPAEIRKPYTDSKDLRALPHQPKEVMVAANGEVPGLLAESTQPSGPTPEDLAETIDVRFTAAIQELADSLNNSVPEIYAWVRNNILFDPTYGSIQGADLCLQTQTCNAFDTASLLIALYRISDIPARYVQGQIRVPIAEALSWLDAGTPEAALAALVSGDIPATFVTAADGTVTDIQLEHLWIKAFVDYVPSRAEVESTGDQYVPLDASFKLLDADGAVVVREDHILPGTLPYTVVSVIEELAALTDELRPAAGAPVVSITDVVPVGTGQIEIRGSVSDSNLVSYQVEYSFAGSDVYIPLVSGTSPVSGVLATLDTTVLENGVYEIRLKATDAFGTTKTVSLTHEITGQLKVGSFSLAFQDLTVPMVGIPITITRTYNSFDKAQGSFGVGWSLALADIKLQEDLNRNVILTLPDGRRTRFGFKLAPYGIFAILLAEWEAEPGVYDHLEIKGSNRILFDALQGALIGFVEDLTIPFECFEPPGYILTLKNGTRLTIEKEELGFQVFLDKPCGMQYVGPLYGKAKLTRIEDRNGNFITFSDEGIIHSTGKSVVFARDDLGRITTITDPMGNALTYAYGDNGDLVSSTDQEGKVTSYTYDTKHNLIDIIDPRGVRAVRTEYDDNGRITATTDAKGNRIEITHDLTSKQEIVRDQLGNPTIYEYDNDGNVVAQTDALGNTITFTYDAEGNLLSETDPLDNTTEYTYDDRGNQLTQTDPLGNVTRNTYDGNNNLLTTEDPLGNVTENTYDTRSNLLLTTAPDGATTRFTYDARGNPLTITDAAGNLNRFEYDGSGNLISRTDAVGHVISYTYDANGNRLTETTTYTTPAGVRTVTTWMEYDAENRVVKKTDVEGNVTLTEYDELGNRVATVDALGRRTEFVYDQRGLLTDTVFPDDTPGTDADNARTSSVYDAAGREVTTIDELGRKTGFVFDAVGQLVETVVPDITPADLTDNPRTITEYDGADQVTAQIDETGNRTEFIYDDAGRQTSVRDALGNETLTVYDAADRNVAIVDALGHTTSFTYDARGRTTSTTFADGTSTSVTFDDIGRVVGRTDQSGRTTGFEYDVLGRLTAVVDALGQRTEYAYDEMGNLVRQTDANGHSTTYEYDAQGRRVATVLPLGQRSTTTYDAVGNVAATTDFNGRTMAFAYDARDRLIEKRFADGSVEAFTYADNGLRSTAVDVRGTTTWTYDERDRLSSRIDPDGRTISYAYDDAGNRRSVAIPSGTTTYTYDALNRLETVTDPDSNLTTYHYDAASNLVQTDFPNNTVETRGYDDLNRLIDLATTGPKGVFSSYEYQLDAVGNRISVTEHDGRRVEYGYDALYRLVGEDIFDPGELTPSRSIDYTYDPVGNRLSRDDTTEGLTTYRYDDNDRLLRETLASDVSERTYDDNGSLLSKSKNGVDEVYYHWDQENRLVGVDANADGGVDVINNYDVDGIRVAQTENVEDTRFLIDSNRPFAQVLEEYNASGIIKVPYVHGLDLISQSRIADGIDYEKFYYHVDGLGSTRALTDLNGNPLSRYMYDAFGRLITESGATDNVYLFAGEQRDISGLVYLRSRYLDVGSGRFFSRDPFEGFLSKPVTRHGYLYANTNPANAIDPSGQFTLGGLSLTSVLVASLQLNLAKAGFRAIGRTALISDKILVPGFSIRQTGHLLLAEGIDRGLSIAQAGEVIIAQGYWAIGAVSLHVYADAALGSLRKALQPEIVTPYDVVVAVLRPVDLLIDRYIIHMSDVIKVYKSELKGKYGKEVKEGQFADDIKKITCLGSILLNSVRSPFAHLFGGPSRTPIRYIKYTKCGVQHRPDEFK